jgi:hypothetical protein
MSAYKMRLKTKTTPKKCFFRLLKDRDGITALEFAFVSPVMLLLMMGVIEFSMIMFTQAVMESATGNTARMGKTGFTAPGVSRQDQLVNNVIARTAGLLDPNLIDVDTTTYPSFDSVHDPEPYIDSNGNGMYSAGEPYTDINGNGQWDEDMGSAGAGNANDIVVYTVSYPWSITTPVISAIIGNVYTINARTVVKNEPW